jgi:AcrR family transcriptional regulator
VADAVAPVDRALAVRDAIVAVVAERGLEATTMSAVAAEAGVATGTAYVHYPSKEELLIGGYVHVKQQLGAAATADLTGEMTAHDTFEQIWTQAHAHLQAHPEQARFLVQFEHSSLGTAAHARMQDEHDPLTEATTRLLDAFVPLPPVVLYDLALGPMVRLVAAGQPASDGELRVLRDACWRAVARPDGRGLADRSERIGP